MSRVRKRCPRCKGEGEVDVVIHDPDHGRIKSLAECVPCGGTGFDESAEALTEEFG